MCLFTMIYWVVLIGIVFGIGAATGNDNTTGVSALVAVGLGLIGPFVFHYWRPLFAGWARKNKALAEKLQAEGVLTADDLEHGARPVTAWEVDSKTNRKRRQSRQQAYLLLDHENLRILGERWCINAARFRLAEGICTKCPTCFAIWACGGEPFAITADVDGEERHFRVLCHEGRTLRQRARHGAMLREMLASSQGEEPAASSQPPSSSKDTAEGISAESPTDEKHSE